MKAPRGLLIALASVAVWLTGWGFAAASPGPVRINIKATPEGLSVTYALPVAVTSMPLQLSPDALPAFNIRPQAQTLALVKGELRSETPFRQVTLIVSPDRREVDSVYPMMQKLSRNGAIFYAPYLLPAAASREVRLSVEGERRILKRKDITGYLLVGAEPVRRNGFRSVVAGGAPPWVGETVVQRTGQILAFYRDHMGTAPEREPLVVVAFTQAADAPSGGSFRGDVTSNGVVFLRVRSKAAPVADTRLIGLFTGFLGHELFHLWNRSGDADSANWWLHEGGAEYASWLAASALWPAETPLETRLDAALRTCAMYLGGRPLASLTDPESRSVRYPCGAVVQWLVDVGARADGKGRDVFGVWARLTAVRNARGSYGPADLQETIGKLAPGAAPLVEAMLHGGGPDRWSAIPQALNAMGAQVSIGKPPAFLLRLTAAQALVQSACGEVHGVGDGPDGLFVQAPEACRVFGAESVLASVDGVAPMANPARFHEILRKRCGTGAKVAVVIGSGSAQRTETVKCTVPVDQPPPELRVMRALPAT